MEFNTEDQVLIFILVEFSRLLLHSGSVSTFVPPLCEIISRPLFGRVLSTSAPLPNKLSYLTFFSDASLEYPLPAALDILVTISTFLSEAPGSLI